MKSLLFGDAAENYPDKSAELRICAFLPDPYESIDYYGSSGGHIGCVKQHNPMNIKYLLFAV